jgi:hypothetical protein
MATAMFSETLVNTKHMMRLSPKSQSYTLKSENLQTTWGFNTYHKHTSRQLLHSKTFPLYVGWMIISGGTHNFIDYTYMFMVKVLGGSKVRFDLHVQSIGFFTFL